MNDFGVIGSIFGIIAVITFFVMAWRLGSISKYVLQIGNRISDTPFYEAQTTELLDKLHTDVDDVAYKFKNRHEFSVKRACEFANKFLDNLKIHS